MSTSPSDPHEPARPVPADAPSAAADAASPSVEGLYFDGRSTRPAPVVLTLVGDSLQISGGVERSEPLAALRLSEPMGTAPRLISFGDGAQIEVRDHAGFTRLLQASRQRDSAVVRWGRTPRAVAMALIGLLLLGWFGWQHGLPWAARHAAPWIPQNVVEGLSQHTLQLLDSQLLKPSKGDEARQRAIEEALRDMAFIDGRPIEHRLLFRAAPRIGANAFALPDGTLVVTDELVELADGNEEVLAVLAHELGHVHERHGLRLLLQSTAAALLMSWYLGDFSGWLATGSTVLAQAAYSRDMETAADDFAARLLNAQGQSSEALATMLEKLLASDERKTDDTSWLSSHPQTAQRVQRLRDAQRAAQR
ncbi:MAG: M48 family metallopeptidase [Burkholderiaceae bacterium]